MGAFGSLPAGPPGGVMGVVSDGRVTEGSLLLPGVVSVWAKAPELSRKPMRENRVAAITNIFIGHLPL